MMIGTSGVPVPQSLSAREGVMGTGPLLMHAVDEEKIMASSSVLIVDDDLALLDALPRVLQLKVPSLAVTVAESGTLALELIERQEFDAIVTDIRMPGLDGLALLEHIQRLRPFTPTVLITGHGDRDLGVRALNSGAYAFIEKPLDRDFFTAWVKRAIQLHQLHRRMFAQTRQMELLAHVCREINRVLEAPTVMRTLIRHALELVGAEAGMYGLVENGQMVFRELQVHATLTPISYTFPPGYGVPGRVLQSRQTYVCQDAARDSAVIPEIREALNFYNFVNVPILGQDGAPLGCFEILNKRNRLPFEEADVKALEALAAAAAIGLMNARLLEERRHTARP